LLEVNVTGCVDAALDPSRGEAVDRTPEEASIEKKMVVARMAVLLRFMVGGPPRYTAAQELNGPVPFTYGRRLVGLLFVFESADGR
jgi:hypothetical protein